MVSPQAAVKIAWEQKQRRQRMVLAAQRARVVQRATLAPGESVIK